MAIMENTLSMQKILAFLKTDLVFACCWPLPPIATKCEKIRHVIFRCFSILHGAIMMIAIIYTIYVKRSNLLFVMKLCCELCTTTAIPVQIIIFSAQYDRLQYVAYELENYCERAKSRENNVFHRYIRRSKSIYVCAICAFTITVTLLVIKPIVEPHPFPIDVSYPFTVDSLFFKIIMYLHHTLLLYQSYMQVCSNVFIALLLWFVAARCDILSDKFRAVTKFRDLRACIEEHQELVLYGREVAISIRYIILTSIIISSIIVIFSGVTFLGPYPIAVKSTFFIFFISSLTKVFLVAWPADHLLNASTGIAYAAYESMWYNEKVEFQKNILHILLRGIKPIVVSVPCMLPTVSLNYYASYVSTACSYLATCRVLLAKNDDN